MQELGYCQSRRPAEETGPAYVPFGAGRRCGPWGAVVSFEQLDDLQTFSYMYLALVRTEGRG